MRLVWLVALAALACGGTSRDAGTDPVTPSPDAAHDAVVGDAPPTPPIAADATPAGYDCAASCASRESLCGVLTGFDCVGFCEAAIDVGLDAACPAKAEAFIGCMHTMCDLTACSSLGAAFANECAGPYCTMNFTPSCDTLE